jgi:hypothetical protein
LLLNKKKSFSVLGAAIECSDVSISNHGKKYT